MLKHVQVMCKENVECRYVSGLDVVPVTVSIPIVRTPARVNDTVIAWRPGCPIPNGLSAGPPLRDAVLSSLFKTGGRLLPQSGMLEAGQHAGCSEILFQLGLCCCACCRITRTS